MDCGLISRETPAATRTYVELNSRAKRALESADFRKASKLFEWAYVEAKRIGDPRLLERAYCSLAVPAIEMGSAGSYSAGLRDIVADSPDAGSRYLAALTLSSAFSAKEELDGARIYALRAYENARQLKGSLEMAFSLHKLGVRWLLECRYQDAQRSFEDAIELGFGDSRPNALALAKSNLGVCIHRMGQETRADALLQESVDDLAAMRCRLYENAARLSYGFSLMEMDEFEMALDQADHVLSSHCTPQRRKHALYLCGEAYSCLDLPHEAKHWFALLQQEFYPGMSGLLDTLASVRTYHLVNWPA